MCIGVMFMAKPFTDNEYKKIRKKLIESCERSWSRYGYKKTSVSDLCKMTGISTGAFYLFYGSKELLFVDTADTVLQRLMDIMENNIPSNPTKHDFANSIKLVAKEIIKVEWILSLKNDFEVFLRKLPENFLDENFKKDVGDFHKFIDKHGFKLKVDIEEMTSVFWILFMTLKDKDIVGDNYFRAFEFILDSTIENLFE